MTVQRGQTVLMMMEVHAIELVWQVAQEELLHERLNFRLYGQVDE